MGLGKGNLFKGSMPAAFNASRSMFNACGVQSSIACGVHCFAFKGSIACGVQSSIACGVQCFAFNVQCLRRSKVQLPAAFNASRSRVQLPAAFKGSIACGVQCFAFKGSIACGVQC
jgi:hypothetical protein